MPQISINGSEISYQIKYSNRRRSVQIKITPAGGIEVAAPVRLPLKEIEYILRLRSAWITMQLARLAKLAANPLNSALEDGAQLLFLGEPRQLSVSFSPVKRARVSLAEGRLLVELPLECAENDGAALRDVLQKWYIRSARKLLAERTAYWAEKIAVRPQHISIRDQKTRWGSASQRGNVNYNWRIVMAPLATTDYLVVHELCHIKIANHSAVFWLLVSQFIPDYKRHRAWLRQHGALLTRFLETL